jgi:hypothetical protein
MTIHLDHILVPAKDRIASARLLAGLLGVPWSATGIGPFAPVFVSDSLTLDFDTCEGQFPLTHYCFRVDDSIDTAHGGKIVYWSEPDGHAWEMLTVSYARQP